MGIVVNCGGNAEGHYIGGHNWFIGDAPFVGGVGGFASVFVTASFACKAPKPSSNCLQLLTVESLDGGTESIAITAGETKDLARNLPKVVRNVFWRTLLFYIYLFS
jgi:AAT family amino acid transporter